MTSLVQAQREANIPYLVSDPIDLLYLLHKEFSLGRLWISKEKAILFVDGRYDEVARTLSGIEVKPLTELDNFLAHSGACGFDQDHLTYGQYLALSKKREQLQPLFSPIKALRRRKTEVEIKKMEEAAKLCMLGMGKVMNSLREGMSEKEVANLLDSFWKGEGGDRFSFEPIIAFGANSSKPHHRSSMKTLQQGELVLIDIGVVVDHYHSDMTRVFAFGAVDKKWDEIYRIVYEAKEHAVKGAKKGVPLKEVDRIARDWITKKGYGEQFMHGLGHGIGLQTHEEPFVRKEREGVLEEGNVVTIEPGIYLSGVGGIRLEDMILIEEKSARKLTPEFDLSELQRI